MTDQTTQRDKDASLYASILQDISTGYLEGGQRLKVAELAERHGVSTSPVREVLRRMQGEGFVDISPNRGATVRKADANTIQNVFEILQLLEPYFVKWFAEYAQPEMLEHMQKIQAEIETLDHSDLIRFRKLDGEFHRIICEYHYNTQAAETWRNLRRALNVFGAKLRINPARFEAIKREHRALLDAFQANDIEAATAVINTHIDGSYTQMSQQMRMLNF